MNIREFPPKCVLTFSRTRRGGYWKIDWHVHAGWIVSVIGLLVGVLEMVNKFRQFPDLELSLFCKDYSNREKIWDPCIHLPIQINIH